MKFDSSLDKHENIQRMQVRACDDPAYLRVRWAELLPDELATLRKLNTTLLAIEQRYQAEEAQLNPALEARTARIKERGQARLHEVNLAGGDVALSDFVTVPVTVFSARGVAGGGP